MAELALMWGDTVVHSIDWDTMEHNLFGSDLGKSSLIVRDLCSSVLDMTGGSLCDIQMGS